MAKVYRYGLSGRTAAYWAHAGLECPRTFRWHRRRPCATTAIKRRYLLRWWERSKVRSRAHWARLRGEMGA